jgi:hypothetical protein
MERPHQGRDGLAEEKGLAVENFKRTLAPAEVLLSLFSQGVTSEHPGIIGVFG